jgi:hypothetical protein
VGWILRINSGINSVEFILIGAELILSRFWALIGINSDYVNTVGKLNSVERCINSPELSFGINVGRAKSHGSRAFPYVCL